ncbi:hypothetical protein J2794_001608 [Paraburkholderia terricola]|uniref:hypothetical protein n=1 Tax=Paraburkholderia terricola TaxID=169427 RepID=UPI00285622CF|nr:hypothetical protein [Paraburkholderia terricola]MDR6445517.1 hypothetical protein [Paraburkholderia terricola]
MSVPAQKIDQLAKSIIAEVPASKVNDLLVKFPTASASGNCGGGCGEGCCGAACSTTDGLNVDRFGHSGFDAATLNEIGKNQLTELRQSIKTQLMTKASAI